MKLSHLALALSLALGASTALAQNAPAPAAPGAPGMQRTPPVAGQTSGALARFIVGPGGRVRGLALDNGAVVMLHPRAAEGVAARTRVGAPLRVEGFTRPGASSPVFFRATVRAADGTVLVAPPAPPAGAPGAAVGMHRGRRGMGHGMGRGMHGGMAERRAARGARLAALPPQSVNGTVQQVLAGPRGGVRALLLSNNATVYVPRGMHEQLRQRGVRVGESVRASGRGNATPQGTGVVAEQLAFADGTTLTANLAAPPPARNAAPKN